MMLSRHGSVAAAAVTPTLLLVVIAGTAAPASAAPPNYRYQNREANSGASLASFAETSDGYRFAFLAASQYFDRAGTYEGAEVYLYEETGDGNSYGFKEAACPVDRSALAISKTDATFAARVDTANCFFNGGCSVDFATGEWTCGNGFSGTLDLTGSWQDAAATDSSQSNGRYASPSEKFNYTCSFRAGNSHAHAEVLVNGESLGSAEWSNVFQNDCNVLSKIK